MFGGGVFTVELAGEGECCDILCSLGRYWSGVCLAEESRDLETPELEVLQVVALVGRADMERGEDMPSLVPTGKPRGERGVHVKNLSNHMYVHVSTCIQLEIILPVARLSRYFVQAKFKNKIYRPISVHYFTSIKSKLANFIILFPDFSLSLKRHF